MSSDPVTAGHVAHVHTKSLQQQGPPPQQQRKAPIQQQQPGPIKSNGMAKAPTSAVSSPPKPVASAPQLRKSGQGNFIAKPPPKTLINTPGASHLPQRQQLQQLQQQPVYHGRPPPIQSNGAAHKNANVSNGPQQDEEETSSEEEEEEEQEEEEQEEEQGSAEAQPTSLYQPVRLEELPPPAVSLETGKLSVKSDVYSRRFFIHLSGSLREVLAAGQPNSLLNKFVNWDSEQLKYLLNAPIKDADKVLEFTKSGTLAAHSSGAHEGQQTVHEASIVSKEMLANTFVGKLEIVKATSTISIPLALIADTKNLSGWNTFARPGASGSRPEDYAMCYISGQAPTISSAPEVVLNNMKVIHSQLFKKFGHMDESYLMQGLRDANAPADDDYFKVAVNSPLYVIIRNNLEELKKLPELDWNGVILVVPGSTHEVKIPIRVIAKTLEIVRQRINPLRRDNAGIYDLQPGIALHVELFDRVTTLTESQLDQQVHVSVDFKLTYAFPRSSAVRTAALKHGSSKTAMQKLMEYGSSHK